MGGVCKTEQLRPPHPSVNPPHQEQTHTTPPNRHRFSFLVFILAAAKWNALLSHCINATLASTTILCSLGRPG